MNTKILVVNSSEAIKHQLKQSDFSTNLAYCQAKGPGELLALFDRSVPDILICPVGSLPSKRQVDLSTETIARLKKHQPDLDIIAAVTVDNIRLGVEAIHQGASDYLVLPVKTTDFNLYVNRALKRIHLKKHLCFDDNCYKNRFARSQKNYQQLFNEVPCFIYLVDRNYHITDSNRKFNEYFGEHPDDYCFGICKNRDEPCRYCPVMETFKDGKNHGSQAQIISSDGVKHTVLGWTAPILNHKNEITEVMVVLTDITEVRRLEDHLTSLGFMIGSISHGIKGLLTGLDSGIYQMGSGIKNKNFDRITQGYEITEQMTSRIKKLVLDILYYTKTRRFFWETIPVRSFIKETLLVIRNSAKKQKIRIIETIHLNKETDSFEVDQTSLQTALINILENGIEACLDNTARTDHTITVNVFSDSDDIFIQIQDTGTGMDQATLKNCFSIFFSSKGDKGTGLGLYIAHKVITQHRGTIKATSSIGLGTTFLITIPRNIPETAKKNITDRSPGLTLP